MDRATEKLDRLVLALMVSYQRICEESLFRSPNCMMYVYFFLLSLMYLSLVSQWSLLCVIAFPLISILRFTNRRQE